MSHRYFRRLNRWAIKGRNLEQILLKPDVYETFRPSDAMGLSRAEAADEMGITRSTFTSLIDKASNRLQTY